MYNTTDQYLEPYKAPSMATFTQDHFPIKSSDDPDYSVDVFTMNEDGMINTAYYHFEDKGWYFHGDTLYDMEGQKFTWIYPPPEMYKASGLHPSS